MNELYKVRGVFTGTESTYGTDLNQSTEYNLSFADSLYTGGHFYYTSSTYPDRIYISRVGDYLLSVTMPLTSDSSTRNAVACQVYVNGSALSTGYFSSSYMRRDDGHHESSNHINLFLNDLNVDDYITISVFREANGGNCYIDTVIDKKYTVLLERISKSVNAFAAATIETTNGTDFNLTTPYPLKWLSVRNDSYYTHSNSSNPENITLTTSGVYLGYINLPLKANADRQNITGKVLLDGTTVSGGIFQQGYMRHDDGHNEASIHWAGPIYYDTSTSGIVTVTVEREAAANTVTVLTATSGSIYLEHLDNANLFIGYGSKLEGSTEWHPGSKTAVDWEEISFKDTNVFSHNTSSNPHEIEILQDGDYLVVFNVALELNSGERINERMFVGINYLTSSFYESNHYNTYDASGAFDGIYGDCNDTDAWWSGSENEAWVGCEFISPRIITKVTLHPQWSSVVDSCPSEFEVRAANSAPTDGLTEGTVLTHVTGVSWSSNDPGQTFSFSNSTAYTHYWITCLDKVDGFGRAAEYRIAEIDFGDSVRSYGTDIATRGAMCKSFFIRNYDGHDHGSGCLVYLLENVVSGARLTIEVISDGTSGSVVAENNAVLLIKKRDFPFKFLDAYPNNDTYYRKFYDMSITSSGSEVSGNYDTTFYYENDNSVLGTVSGTSNGFPAVVYGTEFNIIGDINWYVRSVFSTVSGFSDVYSFTRDVVPFGFYELPIEGTVFNIGVGEVPQLSTTVSASLSDCRFDSYILMDGTDEVLVGPTTLSGVGTISGTWGGYFQGRKYDIYTKAVPLGKYEGDEVVSSGTYFRTSGWQSGYKYRRKITISGSKIIGNHANFPAVFQLTGTDAQHFYNNTNQFYDTTDEYRIGKSDVPLLDWDFGGTTGTGSILGWTYRQIDAPAFPGIAYTQDYVTFEGDGLENALGEDYESNESDIHVYLRFRPHNVNLGEYQNIWKSGSYTNGIAVGLTPNGYLGVRVGNLGDGEITISGALINNKWYSVYVYNDQAILIDEDDNRIRQAGEITPTDGTNNPSVGGAYGDRIMTQENGTGQPFYGDLDKVVIYDNSDGTTYRDTPLVSNIYDFKRKYMDFVLIDDATEQPLDVFFETLTEDNGSYQITFWSKIPTLSGGADKDLYMYYGGTGDSDYIYDYSDSTSVWDSSVYRAVYLMEAPSFNDDKGGLLDCTSNALHLNHSDTLRGNSITLVSGVVGYAIDFNNGGYMLSGSDLFSGDNVDFSIMCVLRTNQHTQQGTLWHEGGTGTGAGIGFNDGKFIAAAKNGGYDVVSTTSSGYANNEHYFFYTEFDRSANTMAIYTDGYNLDNSGGGYNGLGSTNPAIGGALGGSNPVYNDTNAHYYRGELSLMWFFEDYGTTTTSGRIITHYNNIMDNSNFFTLGEIKTPFYDVSYDYNLDISLKTTTDGYLASYSVIFVNPYNGVMSTVSGVEDEETTPTQHDGVHSGSLYYWYPVISGSHYYLEDSDRYSFTRSYICSGYTAEDNVRIPSVPVRLYRRDTGELITETDSTGSSGVFSMQSTYGGLQYAVALHPTDSGTNALIYDWLTPGE